MDEEFFLGGGGEGGGWDLVKCWGGVSWCFMKGGVVKRGSGERNGRTSQLLMYPPAETRVVKREVRRRVLERSFMVMAVRGWVGAVMCYM